MYIVRMNEMARRVRETCKLGLGLGALREELSINVFIVKNSRLSYF